MSRSAMMRRSVAKTELEMTKKLARGISTPRSLTVHLLIENLEFDQLMELEIDARHYDSHHAFADDYLVTKCLSKSPSIDLKVDRQAVALSKWKQAELECASTNERLFAYRYGELNVDYNLNKIIIYIQQEIRKILGPLNKVALDRIESLMSFGPGSTTQVKGIVTKGRKFSTKVLDVTPRLVPFGVHCIPQVWKQLSVKGFNLRQYSDMAFVPKNAKTDRTICIEPTLNIYVQKGIGAYVRERLQLDGLNLQTQEWNQTLASFAHAWDLTTLDLSAASDTVSFELIRLLLPRPWFDLFHFCRTDKVATPDGVVDLEKWSSMGNGYTFELESLIFWSILKGVRRFHNQEWRTCHIAVYGDDMIFPNEWRDDVERALNFLGFKVNTDKSFGKGRFHESCGCDFFDGRNVRPIFFRYDDYDHEKDIHYYLYGNLVRHWAHRRNGGDSFDKRCLPAWIYCYTAVPSDRRCHVPTWDYSTNGFVCNFDESKPDYRNFRLSRDGALEIVRRSPAHCLFRRRGWYGFAFTVFVRKPVERVVSMEGAYIASLQCGSDFTLGREALRNRTMPASYQPRYILDWPSYGPWV